jgi:DNA replication protein DnaC
MIGAERSPPTGDWMPAQASPSLPETEQETTPVRDGVDHPRYLLRLAELELIDRERRMIDRQIRAARFPAVKTLDSFDFTAIQALNKMLVLDLARGDYITRRENVIALGPSGTGKSHLALALELAACHRGFTTGFVTAAGLVHQLMEARDEKRLLKLQAHLAGLKLLIIDELGYVPLSLTGSELLFEVFSQRYERGSTIVTSNLPFEDWTSMFSSERLTGALLDRLTHHVHILEMNGDSYWLKQSKSRRRKQARSQGVAGTGAAGTAAVEPIDPDTGEISDPR